MQNLMYHSKKFFKYDETGIPSDIVTFRMLFYSRMKILAFQTKLICQVHNGLCYMIRKVMGEPVGVPSLFRVYYIK